MKCERCGAILQENSVRCNYCGNILQMVPDYNPLEDVISEEVRSAINVESNRNQRPNGRPQNKEMSQSQREAREQEMRRRREIERRRALKKKRRNILLGSIAGIFLLFILIIYLIYSNSYNGQMKKGLSAVEDKEYQSAIEYFDNCISKDSSKIEAYLQLASVYLIEEDYVNAELILLQGIYQNPDDIELNEMLISCYVLKGDMEAIADYVNALTNEEVLEALSAYQPCIPEFSLAGGEYEDVQELTITCDNGKIYYTTDGTEATEDSTLYSGAIQISEGTTTIRAIAVNNEGVPSDEYQVTYTVELPMESAPIVTPSTGQYTSETTITVQVPQGYTAYYTLDNTVPDTSSKLYTGPISMPEGNTIFTVVLVSADGRYSDTTKRNYDLVLPSVSDDADEEE